MHRVLHDSCCQVADFKIVCDRSLTDMGVLAKTSERAGESFWDWDMRPQLTELALKFTRWISNRPDISPLYEKIVSGLCCDEELVPSR